MKKLFSILLVAVLIVSSFATVAFAADGTATATVSKSQEVKAGDTVTLNVTVKGAFSNFQLTMKADSGLTITGISGGDVTANPANGRVAFSSSNNTEKNISFTVTVKVSENAKPGSYNVTADLSKASMIVPVEEDNDDIKDGLIRVSLSDGSATLTVVCDHVWGEWVETKAPTCTADGEETRTCSACGKTETRKVDKLAHAWGEWVETKAPTCTADGEETRTCSACGETETRKVSKVDHKWGEWVETKAPTCTADGEETRVCSVCGEKETRPVDMIPHNWGEWIVTEEPTCTKEGTKTRTCSICGEKQTEKIAKTEHNWSEWKVEKAATCTEDGLKSRTCSLCGEKQTEVIPSSEGHTWGEWTVVKAATCTEDGEQTRTCSACGEVETVVIEAPGHTWATEWSTDECYHWHVCSVCGAECEHHGEHTWGEWDVTKEATSTEAGEKERTCSVCSYKEVKSIPATGEPTDPPKTGDMTMALMIGGFSILLLLLIAALYYIKRKASEVK